MNFEAIPFQDCPVPWLYRREKSPTVLADKRYVVSPRSGENLSEEELACFSPASIPPGLVNPGPSVKTPTLLPDEGPPAFI